MAVRPRTGRPMVEVLRLAIVLLFTAAGHAVGTGLDDLLGRGEPETTRLVASVLGALTGYLAGGWLGRAVVRGVDTAGSALEHVPAAKLVAACIGAALGALAGLVVLLPVVLLPYQRYTVPVMLLVVLVLAYAGGRLGSARGADLGRFVGVRGRLDVRTPSRGSGVKVLDTSALVDARVVDVARAGFLEGTLVVPTFVLDELQALADAGEDHRRRSGRRGLEALHMLQDESLVAVEVTEESVPGVAEVDAKLATLCRQRGAALITTDGNLARVAEIGGVRVLNLHALADAVRPPVLPGERLVVRLVRPGRDAGQGVAYLDDGTMVVVEGGAGRIGEELPVDVTSIVQNRQGRMLFASCSGGDDVRTRR
ncbi:PIN/TRAM domain-containing protein [Egicoccus sp. AB-alg6-2]|uniref:PIN/TRAM domain-containing protein n=1 Tax=Egicoccus sp. AB-alg6-2 TaxID=3242692 RepID=UPI00359CBFD3